MTAVYMDWKMTRNPTMTAMAITTRSAILKPGKCSGVIIDMYSCMVCT